MSYSAMMIQDAAHLLMGSEHMGYRAYCRAVDGYCAMPGDVIGCPTCAAEASRLMATADGKRLAAAGHGPDAARFVREW